MKRLMLAIVFGVLVTVAASPSAFAQTEPPSTSPPDDQTLSEEDDGGFCDAMPWVAGTVCDGVATVVGGGAEFVVEGGAKAALRAVVGFVVEGGLVAR